MTRNFALTEVVAERSVRRFVFQRAGSGSPGIQVIVVADMSLVRKYEVPLQELPLLCLQLLAKRTDQEDATVVFPESEMIEYADRRRRAKVEFHRRVPRPGKPAAQNDG